jgi:hypothetical protein
VKAILHICTGCPKSCSVGLLKYSTVIFLLALVFFYCQQLAALVTLAHVSVSLASPEISDFLICFQFAVFVSLLLWP